MVIAMKNIRSYIPTVIISVLIPLFYYSLDKVKTAKLYEFILTVIYCLSVWIIYFQIVAKCRKNDVDKKKKIICSFIIQFIVCIPVFLIPLIYQLRQPLEKGHHTPIEMLILPVIIVLEPFLNYLWCAFVNLIIIKTPNVIYTKIKRKIK